MADWDKGREATRLCFARAGGGCVSCVIVLEEMVKCYIISFIMSVLESTYTHSVPRVDFEQLAYAGSVG